MQLFLFLFLFAKRSRPSNCFTFVLGFSGITIVPTTVVPAIIQFIIRVLLHREPVMASLLHAFTADIRIGSLTPINIICNVDGEIISKQLTYSALKTRAWGLEPRCGNQQCISLPGNIHFFLRRSDRGEGNHDFVRCKCVSCHWASGWIQRPAWLMPISEPYFFLHDFPLTQEQRDTFTSAMIPPAASEE